MEHDDSAALHHQQQLDQQQFEGERHGDGNVRFGKVGRRQKHVAPQFETEFDAVDSSAA